MTSVLHLTLRFSNKRKKFKDNPKNKLRPSPLFFRFASNAFPDIGSVGRSVGRIEKKKNL